MDKANVLLMTANGKKAKLESITKDLVCQASHESVMMLSSLQDSLFLFDMGLLTSPDGVSAKIPQLKEPEPYLPPEFPPTIAEGSSPKAWERLFRRRSNWARELANKTPDTSQSVLKLNNEIGRVQRACTIGVRGVEKHMEKRKSMYEDALDWARDLEQEQSYALFHCEQHLDKLSKITAIPEVIRCLGAKLDPELVNASDSSPQVTLQDIVTPAEVNEAVKVGGVFSNRFGNRINAMVEDFEEMIQTAEDIGGRFYQEMIESNPSVEPQVRQASEEITAILENIQRDYRRIETMPNVYNASEMAAAQTTDLLPSLVRAVSGVHQLLRQITQRKNQVVLTAVNYLQKVSRFETRAAVVRKQGSELNVENEFSEVFILVDFVMQLPLVYGIILIECCRRNEWSQKRAILSSSSTEESLTLSPKEQERRENWAEIVGDFVNPDVLNETAMRTDIHDSDWPKVTRDDLDQYGINIRSLSGLEKEVREFEYELNSLSKDTVQRSRKAKGFKNGSLRDAAAVGGSTQFDQTVYHEPLGLSHVETRRLEEKLKNSESRNARLEIMLQRQEMEHQAKLIDGVTFGNATAPVAQQQKINRFIDPITPLSMPQDSGFVSFPQSSPQALAKLVRVEDGSAGKIRGIKNQNLIEELATTRAKLEATIESEKTLQNQVEEANRVKHDLLENLEAREREYVEERRTLEVEKNGLKAKLEEAEEEIVRRTGAPDTDCKTKGLEFEMDKTRQDAAAEVQKAQGQIDFLQSDYTKHREKVTELEQRLRQTSEDKQDIEIKLSAAEGDVLNLHQSQERHSKALRATLKHLTGDADIPVEYDTLMEAVKSNAEISTAKLTAITGALDRAETDRDHFKAAVDDLEERLALQSKEALEAHEKSIEEATTAKLQSSNLINVLQARNIQLVELTANQSELSERLDIRAYRAVEITSRLHAYVSGLLRVLDQVGFAVSVEKGTMIVQKAPKAVGDSTLLTEASTIENARVPGQSTTKSILDSSADQAMLAWAKQPESDVEVRQFDKFVQTVDTFDINIVGEAIVKRLKEAEHTARKWHREARNYRERMYRAQSDAHDKIAYRAFKPGDLALFLPTRGQIARSWAAFNVGAPHYFLREQDSHHLETRDWLLARISKVDERVVDLSKTITGLKPIPDARSIGEMSEGGVSIDDDNPFDLSDGLRWYLLDAAEEKPGAPNILGPSKTTVASAKVDAKGSIRVKNSPDGEGATKTLTRSLDSRRSSTNSKKSVPAVSDTTTAATTLTSEHGSVSSTLTASPRDLSKQASNQQVGNPEGRLAEEVRKDLLWGP